MGVLFLPSRRRKTVLGGEEDGDAFEVERRVGGGDGGDVADDGGVGEGQLGYGGGRG